MKLGTILDRTLHLADALVGVPGQAETTNWVVKTNPFEGGSDHVPFLDADIPGLLLWHFTDQFCHTDGHRLDKVSALTMTNLVVTTAVSAMTLTSADGGTARFIIDELERAALRTPDDIEVGGASSETLAVMEAAEARVREAGEGYLTRL